MSDEEHELVTDLRRSLDERFLRFIPGTHVATCSRCRYQTTADSFEAALEKLKTHVLEAHDRRSETGTISTASRWLYDLRFHVWRRNHQRAYRGVPMYGELHQDIGWKCGCDRKSA